MVILMINVNDFLNYLTAIGSKASAITKIIRKENSLFDLLIQEKDSTKYLKCDYKTFADVLIQETVRNDLKIMHPDLSDHLFGEESNEFTNKLNVTVTITVGANESETESLILQVLDGHDNLASNLAKLIHRDVRDFLSEGTHIKTNMLPKLDIAISDLGIWIDPIDSTAEYIHGVSRTNGKEASLSNVTILIGAFDLRTGTPFAGVIYQPFWLQDPDGVWQHACYWGLCKDGVSFNSDNIKVRNFTFPAYAVTSGREITYFTDRLNRNGKASDKWNVESANGAGYKFVLIFNGLCDAYILSKGSTYKWDTCGPHAVLLAIGGGIADYQQVVQDFCSSYAASVQCLDHRNEIIRSLLISNQLTYSTLTDNNCNDNGFLAYSNIEVAISVINCFVDDLL